MADKKISALAASTIPLASTEVLPIVQGGATVKVAVSNLTAGRPVATGALTTIGTIDSTGDATIGAAAAGTNRTLRINGVLNKASRIAFQASGVDQWLIGNGAASENGNFELYNAVTGNNIIVTPAGNITIPNNLVIGTAGNGIDFSADSSAAGMSSELLDDYEEGTWTPVLRFGGATTGITYISGYQNGLYTKVGNLVTLTAVIYLSSKGTATGDATIIGIPYATANIDGAQSAASIVFTSITYVGQTRTSIDKNTTSIRLSEVSEAGVTTTLTDADFSNGSYIQLSLTYRGA